LGLAEIVDNPDFRDKIHIFDDRSHAGEMLAKWLKQYKGREDAIILAIPAGGVPVAVQVSKKLNVPWDLAVTTKLHIPWNREAGFGAISWDGTVILNKPLVDSLGLTSGEIEHCVEEEKRVIQRRLERFRGNEPFPDLSGKVAIVVDDGLASGFSMLVTAKTLGDKAGMVVVAVPTAPVSAIELISSYVDRIVCLNIRSGPIFAVANAYKVWYDLTDKEVIDILKRNQRFGEA
jgi:putative phosphoribosyl transferase